MKINRSMSVAVAATAGMALGSLAATSNAAELSSTHVASVANIATDTAADSKEITWGPNNVFQRDLRRATIDPESPAMVEDLVSQVEGQWGGAATLNTGDFSNGWAKADPSTPKQDVGWNNCQNKQPAPEVAAALKQVPIPADAVTSEGTDKQLSVWSPSEDKLWEFWVAEKDQQGHWSACHAGVISNVSKATGQFAGFTGATASGLAMAGLSPGVTETAKAVLHESKQPTGSTPAQPPVIDHALYLAIPNPAPSENVVWPAVRSDGPQGGGKIPEGTRLRLKADVDLNGLTPVAKAFARTAQVYGFIVADKAGAVNVSVETGTQDQWQAILGGTPNWQIFDGFPWEELEAIDTTDKGKNTPVIDSSAIPTPTTPCTDTTTAGPANPTDSTQAATCSPATSPSSATGSPSPSNLSTSSPSSSPAATVVPEPSVTSSSSPTSSPSPSMEPTTPEPSSTTGSPTWTSSPTNSVEPTRPVEPSTATTGPSSSRSPSPTSSPSSTDSAATSSDATVPPEPSTSEPSSPTGTTGTTTPTSSPSSTNSPSGIEEPSPTTRSRGGVDDIPLWIVRLLRDEYGINLLESGTLSPEALKPVPPQS